ncbi:MerR family transcriptional regulator [Cyanobium sp. FGCU-52]|nr:MerR family transcriptional regulator [Cyanobium sp. FGCU52]
MSDPSSSAAGEPASSESYGLEELLAAAGRWLGEEITSRTVRLYATQGLIDRPGKEGRHAVYGRRHLLQLLLIRSLARRGLSLSAIAPLVVLPDDELERQLAGDSDDPARKGSNEALDYLQGLKSKAKATARSAVIGAAAAAPPGGLAQAGLEAARSLLPLLGSPFSALPSPSTTQAADEPPDSPSRRSLARSGGTRLAASRWHRFSLAPGVELHLSDSASIPPAGPRRQAWAQRLLERLEQQLEVPE